MPVCYTSSTGTPGRSRRVSSGRGIRVLTSSRSRVMAWTWSSRMLWMPWMPWMPNLPALLRRKAAEARRCDRRGRPGDTPQDSNSIWHARGTRGQRPIMNVCCRPGYTAFEQVFQKARPAGFEPATRCLEGTFEASRDVAWRRSTSHLAVRIVADCRGASRGVCLRWLPYWLPKFTCLR